jgi:hypothetical protein
MSTRTGDHARLAQRDSLGAATENMAKLPDLCYAVHIENGHTVVLKKGEVGFFDTGYGPQGQDIVDRLNERLGVTKAQAAAMELGSIAGFHAPGADPDRYDADGKPKR